jgi:hypothetical protein
MKDANGKYVKPTQEERDQILDDCIYHFNTLDYEAQRMIVNQILAFKLYLKNIQEARNSNVLKPEFKPGLMLWKQNKHGGN